MTIVKHFKNDTDAAVPTIGAPLALPGGFVIAPGNYTFNGVTYQCTPEGFYKFWAPMVATQNKIVYQNDVHALISGIAWACCYGRADESLTLAQRTLAALNSKLRMRCGETCAWAKYMLDSLGVQCRIVNCVTAGTPNNAYDGHVMIEAKVNGAWVLFDISNNSTFGANLPLKDALPLVGATSINPLAADGFAVEPFSSGQFDVTAHLELTMRTPAQKRAEMERILQIPGVTHTDGLTYFYLPAGMESRSAYVTGLSVNYRVITQAAWLSMFYPA